MKKIFFLVGVLVSMLACQKNEDATIPQAPIETVSIGAARETAVATNNTELKVTLLTVNDSRCPVNANCISAGTALLKFAVSDQESKIEVVMNFSSALETANQVDFKLNGTSYRMSVTEVLPYPDTSKSPSLNDYNIEVGIKIS